MDPVERAAMFALTAVGLSALVLAVGFLALVLQGGLGG